MGHEHIVVEVDGVLRISRNYETGLVVISKSGESDVTTHVFDEKLFKAHLKRGFPEKTFEQRSERSDKSSSQT